MADNTPLTLSNLGSRDVVISRSQIRASSRDYERLKAEAERRGVPLRIVSDAEFDEMVGTDPPPVPKPPSPETDGTIELDGRRVLPIRQSDARDFPQYTAAKAKAEELGVSLEIVRDDAVGQSATSSGAVGEGIHIASDGTKCWQIPRSMLRDVQKYEAAKARAAEQGLELLIVPDDEPPVV
jgi:hypothetical protein